MERFRALLIDGLGGLRTLIIEEFGNIILKVFAETEIYQYLL